MSETAPASATEKKPAAKRKRTGPNVRDLIVKAVSESEERSGVSLPALKKALAADGYDVEKNNSRVKISIKSLVTNDILVRTRGTGVSGSFKLNKKQTVAKKKTKPAKKAALKAKQTAAAKKPKTAAAKKSIAKKSPKKVEKPAATEKKPAAKRKRTGPIVRDLIVKAVSESEERSGVSLPALKKALAADGYDVEKNNSRVKISIKSLVTNDILVRTRGTGVSGSFKLNKKQTVAKKKTKPAKKAAPKAKQTAAAKKPKAAAAKKSIAKKSPKKVKKPAAKKSPKKVKKPAAKKITKSPKKTMKPATPKNASIDVYL
ncbi:histone H1-like [Rhinichthys klamathensis goyatoka]|uniref:histone H1-like n=1 Tax=Rhinichthys klamathensis goyatoka TaxID=3034132 RepID=UPI0024B5367F|nr:histone H1-like [Rhinichthys klamathensis goyatoka]